MTDDEILAARDALSQRWGGGTGPRAAPPQGMLLCYQAGLLGSAVSRWRTTGIAGFHADIRLLRRTRGRVGVATRFGVGAPAAVALLEELAAWGVRRFISLGMAGGLQAGQRAGDLVVVERALRDEGTSAHYVEPGESIGASVPLTRRLADMLGRAGRGFVTGTSCTTDAPYRTTRALVDRWTRAGGVAVEMEAAGLFAVGQRRGVEVAAALCLADTLTPGGWRLAFDEGAVVSGVRALFDAAVDSLEGPDGL
jgi:nucleoside phosphorylase